MCKCLSFGGDKKNKIEGLTSSDAFLVFHLEVLFYIRNRFSQYCSSKGVALLRHELRPFLIIHLSAKQQQQKEMWDRVIVYFAEFLSFLKCVNYW